MSLRPGTLCKLKKGTIIDAQDGFVDTFNWMVDFINNLKGDGIITIDTKTSDKPVIKLNSVPLVSGDDTNVVIRKVKSGKNKDKYSIDVYYK